MSTLATRRAVLYPLLVLAVLGGLGSLAAQVRPVYSRGVAGLLHQIQRLQTTASALHVAAHPDDEDSGFIARTARGDHARVAYLSLNRGEGGQNVIGPELFEALGVIRTEELLQARTLDGGDQFFTRTFDFGFSKSLDEAARLWGEREVLGDIVRIIRTYRPLVVYSGFSGTPADGHGQHQLSGKITPLAFAAAGDPSQYPEQIAEGLRPWQARKLYVRQGFRPDPANPPTTRVETGRLDPLIGRTYLEIAMEGRSQHKSQEMGVPELLGPQASALRLLQSHVPVEKTETSAFAGIDTSLGGLATLAGLPPGALSAELSAIDATVREVLDAFDPRHPSRSAGGLARTLEAVRSARLAAARLQADADARAETDFLLAIKERDAAEALTRAAGLVVDPLADTETVVRGETVGVTVRVFADQPEAVAIKALRLRAPQGWTVASGKPAGAAESASPMARFFREQPTRSEDFVVGVPSDAPLTAPYWLARPRSGAMFSWAADSPQGAPFDPPLLVGEVDIEIAGVAFTVEKPVQYRLVDQVRGELRRRVDVVPAVSVALDSPLEIVPLTRRGQPRRIAVRLANNARTPQNGVLRLSLPEGWTSQPAEAPFSFSAKGERSAAVFVVVPAKAAAAGAYAIRAEAVIGDSRHDLAMRVISYPHIQTHRMYVRSEAAVRVLDLEVAPVRVGYIMGSGDQVPDAIRRMGLDLTLLDEDGLAAGDLAGFDVIVVGIRASEARPDFVANHGRLLDFVRAGGTLLVQYQQPDYAGRKLPPFPAEGASRVTDETAPVRILVPDHPALVTPNRIGAGDWDHWVQERNLYAFARFDPAYTALLETTDPGEPPQQGGLLVARVGKGYYVYSAYSWFRQLPAGVPGAYRLFANLLSLPRSMAPATPTPPRQVR
jgi:LmbE family N-acetylglucosaminyl deacetylase